MKCPYRKITYHIQKGGFQAAREEEGFAECYGKECPYYDNGFCKRVLREGGTE